MSVITWRDFIVVTKPGIVISNCMVALGVYFYAVGRSPSLMNAITLGIGTALIIAGSCVANNYIDRNIDSKMQRTAKRPTASGNFGLSITIVYSISILIVGFIIILEGNNLLTGMIGLFGAFWYVIIYTFSKRVTHWATLIGTISGGVPPLAGYAAAVGHLNSESLLLFLILCAWQMPHFYAIAIFRMKQYEAAKVPVLPLKRGVRRTIYEMRVWSWVFACLILACALYTSLKILPLAVMVALAAYWVGVMARKPNMSEPFAWAKKSFYSSLLILPTFSLMLAINPWL